MNGYKFPRTYADLESAPWCDGYIPPKGQVSQDGEHLSIFIKLDWLPEEFHDGISPGGPSLKDALEQLKDYWHDMRPPTKQN